MADNTLTAKLTVDSKGLMKGFKQVQEVLANMQEKTASFGKGLKDIGKSISGVGDTLTRKITNPALIATKALTGMTLIKGFDQLTGIDTAQAELKGLGNDVESLVSILVGIGPALKIIGTLTTEVGNLVTMFSFLFSPIGLIAGALIGLGIGFGIAFMKSEEFRIRFLPVLK